MATGGTGLQGLNTYLALLQSGGQEQFPSLVQQQQMETMGPPQPVPQGVDLKSAFADGEMAARGGGGGGGGLPEPPGVARAFARGGAVRRYNGMYGDGAVVPLGLDQQDYFGSLSTDDDEDDIASVSPEFIAMTRAELARGGGSSGDEKRDGWLALAQAGFATAAGQSPHALSNIGAGGVAGLDALQKMKQQRALQRMREAQMQQSGELRRAQLQQAGELRKQTIEIQKARLAGQVSPLARMQNERAELVKQFGLDDPRVKQYDAMIEKETTRADPADKDPDFQLRIRQLRKANPGMTEEEATNIVLQPENTRAERVQQTDQLQLPGGEFVLGIVDPTNKENPYLIQGDDGKFTVPAPKGTRKAPPGAGLGVLSLANYNKLETQFLAETEGLRKQKAYMETVENSEQGWRQAADSFTASIKTLFDSGELTPAELATAEGRAKLQGLLGSNRIEVVGPGAMTEYDARRVLDALGGDMNAWQNKELVAEVLQDLFDEKYRRASMMRDQLLTGGASTYGREPDSYLLPEKANFRKKKGAPAAPGGGKTGDPLVDKWLAPQ